MSQLPVRVCAFTLMVATFAFGEFPPSLVLPLVYPVSFTDPDIRFEPYEFHYYFGCGSNEICPRNQTLFVFLPPTGGTSADFQLILKEVAAKGLPVIGLNYENQHSANKICGRTSDEDACYTRFRSDRFFGATDSEFVSSAADGITNRLLKLLIRLGWSNFYTFGPNRQLRFERIIFGGHSQGGGFAAFAGKVMLVKRVCQFSSTWDNLEDGTPATWTTLTGKTPSSEYFGFTHEHDLEGLGSIDRIWTALGMGSAPVRLWSDPAVKSSRAQKLYTRTPYFSIEEAETPILAHEVSTKDSATPKDFWGRPVFAPVWLYTCLGI